MPSIDADIGMAPPSNARDRDLSMVLRKAMLALDFGGFEQLRSRYAEADPTGPAKYFDLGYLQGAATRCIALGLHRSDPVQILDLGCGFGYFLFVASTLGHRCLGLDVTETAVNYPMGGNRADAGCYSEMITLLKQRRILHEIRAYGPLPTMGQFDLVTAFEMCFARHDLPAETWSVNEWTFFLRDLSQQLTKGGTVCLQFNKTLGGWYLDSALRDFFLSLDGQVDGRDVLLSAERLRHL